MHLINQISTIDTQEEATEAYRGTGSKVIEQKFGFPNINSPSYRVGNIKRFAVSATVSSGSISLLPLCILIIPCILEKNGDIQTAHLRITTLKVARRKYVTSELMMAVKRGAIKSPATVVLVSDCLAGCHQTTTTTITHVNHPWRFDDGKRQFTRGTYPLIVLLKVEKKGSHRVTVSI